MMKKQIPLLHTHSTLTNTSHFRPHFLPNSHTPFSQHSSLFPLLHLILLSLVSNMSTNPLSKYPIPNLKLVDSCLRLSVLPLSIASIWLTVTDYEDNSSYGALGFTDLTGVKYMVCISFISAIYALGAAISSWITCLVSRAWFFFVSDQLVAYLMVTSTAAVVEILYLAYNGDKEVTWSQACSSYGKFCSRLKLALVFHGLVLCFFFVLAVMSAFRAFSVYEAPHSTDEPKRPDVEEETANE